MYNRRLNRIIRTNRKRRFSDYIVLGAMLVGLSVSGMVTVNAFAGQPADARTPSTITLDCDLCAICAHAGQPSNGEPSAI